MNEGGNTRFEANEGEDAGFRANEGGIAGFSNLARFTDSCQNGDVFSLIFFFL